MEVVAGTLQAESLLTEVPSWKRPPLAPENQDIATSGEEAGTQKAEPSAAAVALESTMKEHSTGKTSILESKELESKGSLKVRRKFFALSQDISSLASCPQSFYPDAGILAEDAATKATEASSSILKAGKF